MPSGGACAIGRLLLLARRWAARDPLDLGRRAPAEPQCRLEALVAELAGVERAAQLVQRREILLADLLAGGLDQDQVARPALGGCRPQERLTLLGREPLAGQHNGLAALEALLH